MNIIKQRIDVLRKLMIRENIDAYYISGTDPHMSEYLATYWKTREFISGFTGSFGEIVITHDQACLWTDSRYFLQAEKELKDSGFEMLKLRTQETIPVEKWLASHISSGKRIGAFSQTLPEDTFNKFLTEFSLKGIELVLVPDLLNEIWIERPKLPDNPIFEHKLNFTGDSRTKKIIKIINQLDNERIDIQLITALDDLAWTFNLRGSDIQFNPLFFGYGIVGKESKILFIKRDKIPDDLFEKLISEGILIEDYFSIFKYLYELRNKKILIDPSFTNMAIYNAVNKSCKIHKKESIPSRLKIIKNDTEISGIRNAMIKDGVALVKFSNWLRKNINKITITEYSAAKRLAEFRSEGENYIGESFAPIFGYNANGAIVHYNVNEQTAFKLNPKGILLFDSGGQYLEGTTDVTRTICLGEPSAQYKNEFTLVLKGMIALSNAIFPEGTKGCNLDILARKNLWINNLNYGHGTGHGVGHFLPVHERHISIRQEFNENNILPGMVMSNEPGFYKEGEYGIRIENMMLCINQKQHDSTHFYSFETLTLCPIDLTSINQVLLTTHEKEWINGYHQKVKETLIPLLDLEHKEYLEEITNTQF